MPKNNSHNPSERSYRNKTYSLNGIVRHVPVVPFLAFGWWLEPAAERGAAVSSTLLTAV
jgi:hypothetical protein